MNIFFLSTSPILSAQYQCDKHVVKMCLESTQLLSNAQPIASRPYRTTHYSHPCSIWARKTKSNYLWLYAHAIALCNEYTLRYPKTPPHQHACYSILQLLVDPPREIPDGPITMPALAMPAQFIEAHKSPEEIAVYSYRSYYRHKATVIHPFNYTNRERPVWL